MRPFEKLAPHVQAEYLRIIRALAEAERPVMAADLAQRARLGGNAVGAVSVCSWAVRAFFGEVHEPGRKRCVVSIYHNGAFSYQLTQAGLDKACKALLDSGQSAPHGGRAVTESQEERPTMSLPCTARVYLIDGPTLRLTGDGAYQNASLQVGEERAVTGITVDGEPITVPFRQVQDVVGVNVDAPLLDPCVLDGRGIRMHSALSYFGPGAHPADPDTKLVRDMVGRVEDAGRYVVILASDMAECIVMIYRPDQDLIVYENEASSPKAMTLYRQGVRTLLMAESEEVAFQTGAREDASNAVAQLDVGNVAAAYNVAADPTEIQSLLAGRAAGPTVEVKLGALMAGWQGRIVAFEDPEAGDLLGKFEIQLTHYNGAADPTGGYVKVKLEAIDRVLSWSVEDGFGADYSEARVAQQAP